jgi:hypothetical protein
LDTVGYEYRGVAHVKTRPIQAVAADFPSGFAYVDTVDGELPIEFGSDAEAIAGEVLDS